ncbi:hypothetical protein FHW69_003201 [Luteibacter sp. Sphag1AF]|nr:hypothetical protein [Luteibacter sp. Sphag1AF]
MARATWVLAEDHPPVAADIRQRLEDQFDVLQGWPTARRW